MCSSYTNAIAWAIGPATAYLATTLGLWACCLVGKQRGEAPTVLPQPFRAPLLWPVCVCHDKQVPSELQARQVSSRSVSTSRVQKPEGCTPNAYYLASPRRCSWCLTLNRLYSAKDNNVVWIPVRQPLSLRWLVFPCVVLICLQPRCIPTCFSSFLLFLLVPSCSSFCRRLDSQMNEENSSKY